MAADPGTPPPSAYAGSTVCKTCHPDVWADFYKNPHFRSIASGKEEPAVGSWIPAPTAGPATTAAPKASKASALAWPGAFLWAGIALVALF